MDYKETYQGKTILVTGGAGAIGSNLSRALGELGAKLVIVLDDLSSASRWKALPRSRASRRIWSAVLLRP